MENIPGQSSPCITGLESTGTQWGHTGREDTEPPETRGVCGVGHFLGSSVRQTSGPCGSRRLTMGTEPAKPQNSTRMPYGLRSPEAVCRGTRTALRCQEGT